MKTFGHLAYESYCAATGRKSLVSGAPLPEWAALAPAIRAAWEMAAGAVVDEVARREASL
jgi:hypothetical protein